ncbi:MAG: zf-HC2 domain-containing protein [Bacteroidales bacterium]|nr:zf-HC2 domain-containing protein [Bacteroidales bacterium]MCM1415238.1 zf-HC2 domain-containing protein [bacterium]MCM1423768.1 zf-HC2 domain-containing protein [bacterium]
MNCKEAEKKIPAFLNDELDGDDLAEFVEHIEACPDCKEELSIQFLVSEGMEQLEKGNNFNLQEALLATLDSADDRIRVNRLLRRVLFWLEIAVAAAVAVTVLIVIM